MSIEYDENDDELRFIAEYKVPRSSSIRNSKVPLRTESLKSPSGDFDSQSSGTGDLLRSSGRNNRYVVINENHETEQVYSFSPNDTGEIVVLEDSSVEEKTFDETNSNHSNRSSTVSDDVLEDIDGVRIRTGSRSKSMEDLLSVMKIEDDGRIHFLDNFKQILNHESRHLVLLNTILKFKHILKESKVSDDVLYSIFYNINDLVEAQNNLVVCLENMIGEWDLNKHLCTHMMDLYVLLHMRCKEYVKNIANAITELRVLFEKNERINSAMQMVLYEGRSLRMEVLIAKPTNWLCNSLENIKSVIETAEGHCDVNMIKETWRKLKDNTDVSTMQCSTLERISFVRSGMFIEILPNDHRQLRHVILFSGMLVCTKQRLFGEGVNLLKLSTSSPIDTLLNSLNKWPAEAKGIERLEAKWFIPLQNIVIHHSKIIENSDKRKLEITNLKEKIRDLRIQFMSEKTKSPESFSFRGIIIKKDADKLHNQLTKAQTELMQMSPTISFVVSNQSEKPHHLLVFSVKDLEIWKNHINELKKEPHIVDTSNSTLASVNHFIESYRANQSIIDMANSLVPNTINEEGVSGVMGTTIESVEGLNPVYSYYFSIEVDSFNVNEVQARTKHRSNAANISWNESFDIDLDCSHTMSILLYQVKKYAEENESLFGYFEFKLDSEELDNKTITRVSPIVGEESSQLQIKVSFKKKSSQDLMKRHPSITKTSLFGIPIETVVERERNKGDVPVENVPIIIWACLKKIEDEGLDVEGIYRISGNKNDITEFYKRLDKNVSNAIKDIGNYDLHTMTGMVKMYLRELPEPLMLTDNCIRLLKISNLTEEVERYKSYSDLIQQLPEPNRSTVVYILNHFKRIVSHSAKNHMVASNLGLIVGPTMILPPSNTDKNSPGNLALETMNSMYLSRVFTQLMNGICSGAVDLDLPSQTTH